MIKDIKSSEPRLQPAKKAIRIDVASKFNPTVVLNDESVQDEKSVCNEVSQIICSPTRKEFFGKRTHPPTS